MNNLWPNEILLLLRKAHKGEDVYLHIQLSDDCWDYTIYNRTPCCELDGGQVVADSLPDALRQIVNLHSLVIEPTGLITLSPELAENIQDAADAGFYDALVAVTLSESDWRAVLNGLELAIDDCSEMAAYADDQEDADCNHESVARLDALHAKISESVYRKS